MAHRILIVDDDQEFNHLLTDVFSQADYDIRTCSDAAKALEIIENSEIDLLVTDFRMPGKSGLELIKDLRERVPDMPIIMVSGFLENGMIRDLIRLGVGGVFMKPLNIFSLLKKTGELIEREDAREADLEGTPASGYGANVGFTFRAFPCRDEHTRDFAKQVYDLRDFGRNLLLIGEQGTDLPTICEDLVAASTLCPHIHFLPPDDFSEEQARAALELPGSSDPAAGLTFVVPQAESLTTAQRETLYAIARAEGPYAGQDRPRRFIFCLNRDLDEFYDEGLIDEEFYLFLGTKELKCPRLSDLSEDLPVMAETLLARDCGGKQLESAARAFLQRHDWQGNLLSFANNLRLAGRLCRGDTVTVEDLRKVIDGQTVESPEADADASPLEVYLLRRREDYLAAFRKLAGRLPAMGNPIPSPASASR